MEFCMLSACLILSVLMENSDVQANSVQGDPSMPTLNFVDNSIQRNMVEVRSRLGEPVEDCICHMVISVPKKLTFITKYDFYQKYTHAYGIPVISSNKVSDAALKRACEVVQVMLADQHALRWYVYKNYGRVGVIGIEEDTTTIPEHRFLSPYYNTRARGLGATLYAPIATVGEENLLCSVNDPFSNEDILVHEFAHSIMELALKREALPGYIDKLQLAYNDALKKGRWYRTYAATNIGDYFAEGVQSYFGCNAESKEANGVHNFVNTRRKLKRYDPKLYTLMREVFPCGNTLKERCSFGNQKPFRLDCPVTSFNPRMDLSYLFSKDYEAEMKSEEEEPLILIANPSKRIIPLGTLKSSKESNDPLHKTPKGREVKAPEASNKHSVSDERNSHDTLKESPNTRVHRLKTETVAPLTISGLVGKGSKAPKDRIEREKQNERVVVIEETNTVHTLRPPKVPQKSTKANKLHAIDIRMTSRGTMEKRVKDGNAQEMRKVQDTSAKAERRRSTRKYVTTRSPKITKQLNNFIERDPAITTPGSHLDATDGDACEDKGWYCDFYVKRKACKQHHDWMYENCRRSCNLCNLKNYKPCKDSDPSCFIWASAGHCKPHKISYKYMVKLCPKSCKLCT